MQVAVIGAGLAGISAAGALQAAGHGVVVFEKSRGAGGRTATRRGPGGMRFDHGAPFLHDGEAPLTGERAVASHRLQLPGGASQLESVGVGSANAPAKAMAEGLDLRAATRVGSIAAQGTSWALTDDQGSALGSFNAVVVTAPAPQTAELLEGPAPHLAARAASVAFAPCWSVMVAWDGSLELPFTAVAGDGPLRWAVAESPKPGREPGERWVLQASAAWSAEHLEIDEAEACQQLLGIFGTATGQQLAEPVHLAAHRWRFSQPSAPLEELFLQHGTLLAAGDWCGGST
ncbi:MAG: FAD-dependent oxidoreductase, partial [Solirubrobacteraceae bacterium]|nr:FAD-dependent oxidoreductase [Solirubrobacteraceae bacterium]